MATVRGLIPRYYAFRMSNSAGFYLPVAIVYLKSSFGLDFVLLAYAVWSLGMVAAEIPTGYLGDLLGRRGSMAVGAVVRALVVGVYPFVGSKPGYLALHVLWAVGWAFRSGTIDAWLYEMLQARFDESEFARIHGRGSTAQLVTSAVTAIAGAAMYTVNPAYPFLANATLALIGLPILLSFPSVETEMDDEAVFTVRDATRMLRLQAGRPSVRWLVAYAALFGAVFTVTRTLEQPALTEVGVPVAGLGVLYAAFKLVSAGVASTAGWFEDRLGARGVFAALVPLYAVAYGAIAVAPALVVPVLFLNRGRQRVTRPVLNHYLNDRLGDVGRATVLSGVSMVLSSVKGVGQLVVQWRMGSAGAVGILPVVGVGIAVAAAALWLATDPVRAEGTEFGGENTGATPTD